MESKKIDFVISWVDGNNEEWQDLRKQYKKEETGSDARKRRYRDWNNLHFLFRGIEKYANWVNHIYLVTPGHYPNWLNKNNDKITVIDQNTIVDKEYIPTFNNCAVELFIYKIPNLSEQFVYLNDDMFILKKIYPEDFFRDELPCDTVGLCPTQAIYSEDGKGVYGIAVMNTRLVAKHFDKKSILKNSRRKLFDIRNGSEIIKTICMLPFDGITGFSDVHTAYSFLRSTYEEVWSKAEDDLRDTCTYRFRGEFNVAHWCMRYWQICTGKFAVRSRKFSRFYDLHKAGDESIVEKCIRKHKRKMICINDNVDCEEDFPKMCTRINSAFNDIFPEKSSFEL